MKTRIFQSIAILTIMASPLAAKDHFSALLASVNFDDAAIQTQPVPEPQPLQAAPAPAAAITMPVPDAAAGAPIVQENQFYQATDAIPHAGGVGCDSSCGSTNVTPGCATGGCHSHRSKNLCGACLPHTQPNLPMSTLYQYFKSDACNSRVWDGYQKRCLWSSKHSRGECDCFTQKSRCGSGSCDTPVVSSCE